MYSTVDCREDGHGIVQFLGAASPDLFLLKIKTLKGFFQRSLSRSLSLENKNFERALSTQPLQISLLEEVKTEFERVLSTQSLQISLLKEVKTEFERALSTQPLQISSFRK